MKTETILEELKNLLGKKGWSAHLGQADQIRFKGPHDKSYCRNPLAALALHHHGDVNLRWVLPGGTLGLDDAQVQDLQFACETRWFRPQLRRQVLDACGLKDEKFEAVFRSMEDVLPKSRLEKALESLSSKDRISLEHATRRGRLEEIKRILGK